MCCLIKQLTFNLPSDNININADNFHSPCPCESHSHGQREWKLSASYSLFIIFHCKFDISDDADWSWGTLGQRGLGTENCTCNVAHGSSLELKINQVLRLLLVCLKWYAFALSTSCMSAECLNGDSWWAPVPKAWHVNMGCWNHSPPFLSKCQTPGLYNSVLK